MRLRPLAPIALLLGLALGLSACGDDPEGESLLEDAPVHGVYVLDVAKTTGGRVKDADGHDVTIREDVLKQVQAGHSADDFRLELRPDGTFDYVIPMGEELWKTGGTWREVAGGVELSTKTVGGEPAPEEMQLVETYRREGAHLVLAQDGRRIYLQRDADDGN